MYISRTLLPLMAVLLPFLGIVAVEDDYLWAFTEEPSGERKDFHKVPVSTKVRTAGGDLLVPLPVTSTFAYDMTA